ncbi:MAG: amino acid permease [Elusimicrobiota bacterium]|jgi:APA family basic amino acid/polyamine antiporter|nr:amino acid permease [Elusimicrobiota bacterium]
MINKLLARKSIDKLVLQSNDKNRSLKKILGPADIVLLGIGCIIGAGIFVLTGQAAAQYAGPGIVLSFVLSAVGCAFAGLCYAEFAAMIPLSGSAYTYSYATMGEFLAWIIGWDLILEYLFAASSVAVGWSGYVVSFLADIGLNIPPEFCNATGARLVQIPGPGWTSIGAGTVSALSESGIDISTLPQVTGVFNFPALLIIALCTFILVIGIRESSKVNNIIVFIKLTVVLLFIAIGIKYVKPENLTPFIPQNIGGFGNFGWSGILRGAGVVFFAYIGFDAVSTVAQEAKKPQRDIPIGILVSLGVCAVLYIAVAFVLTGIVKYTFLNVPDPIAVGVDVMGTAAWLKPLIKIGAVAGLSSVILVMLLAQPRIFFAMANDGLLPPVFRKVHKKFQTPHLTTVITGGAAMILAGFLPIGVLGEMVSIGTLLAFTLVCFGIWRLRHTQPNTPRPFKTPWVPFVPIMGIFICLAQMFSLPMMTWLRLIIWLAIGFLIYFLYGIKHSVLRETEKVSRAKYQL